MKQFSYWKAIYLSFCSGDLYRDVAKNWGLGVLVYLLLVLLLTSLPVVILMQVKCSELLPTEVAFYMSQVPEVTFKDGIAKTPENKRYFIKDHAQKVVGIIDTTGAFPTIESIPADVPFLLTQKNLFSRTDKNTVKMQSIPPKFTWIAEPNVIKQKLMGWIGWIWIIVLPFMLVGAFIYRVIQALFYALIGMMFAGMTHTQLTYSQVLRLSVIAVTPVLFLEMLWGISHVKFPGQFLFYFLVAMCYLFCAVKANHVNKP